MNIPDLSLMARWPRLLLYGALLLVWLAAIAFPFVAFRLATRGQMRLGSDEQRYLRLFLVQERDAEGVGIEWVRPAREPYNCSNGTVTYLFWEGEGENIRYCQCFDAVSGNFLSSEAGLCSDHLGT
jgi:hypothetical protein